jgi:ATP-dependent Lon protease
MNIAVKYLVPRQKKECGLDEVPVTISDNAIRTVIHHYTREAGVRSLERELASICRKVALKVVKESKAAGPPSVDGDGAAETKPDAIAPIEIVAKNVPQYLGVPKFRLNKKEERDEVGLTNGLSVTSSGGGELLACEVAVVSGKGKLVITGLLEKGMEESAQAAMSYVRSRAGVLGLEADFYQKVDVHVHFPEFIRKDGPSAGVTMATSLASALCKVPVKRDLAMTGELTLRGRVMAIGGLKEKLLAAHRAGITSVVIPRENRKDLREVPRRVLKATRIVLVEHMDEVLREALCVPDPDALFGPARESWEYVDGELVVKQAGKVVTPPVSGASTTASIGTGNEPAPVPGNA